MTVRKGPGLTSGALRKQSFLWKDPERKIDPKSEGSHGEDTHPDPNP